MENEIVLFETEDHEVKLHVPVENNTVPLQYMSEKMRHKKFFQKRGSFCR